MLGRRGLDGERLRAPTGLSSQGRRAEMSQENVEIARRAYERFTRDGTIDAEILAPDAEWVAAREDPDAATHRGVEAIGAYFAQWHGAFEEPVTRVEEIIDEGDKVFVWIVFSGRGVTSGAPVEMQQAQIWSFRDEKVVRVEEYFDRAEGLEAAGLAE
jgi:ketosteroid isomerase-like protein